MLNSDYFKLYSVCFPEDSRACTEYIFSHLLNRSRRVEIKENGCLYSVGWLVDKKLVFNGKTLTVPHIVGLCTAPEHRYKGYAAKLLGKMFQICSDSPFITLYPFSHAFYEKFGFTTVSFDFTPPDNCTAHDVDTKYVKKIYDGFINRLDYYIDRTDEDFEFYDGVYKCDGGSFSAVSDGFICPDGYLPSAYEKTDVKGVMARIVNVEKALSLTSATADFPLTLTDKNIEKNNLSFTLNCGRRTPCADLGKEISINDLTAAVFGQNEKMKEIFPLKNGHLIDKY